MKDVISETLSLAGARIRNEDININAKIPPDLPHILANPQRIEQVFLNIISNSIYDLKQKYSGTDKEKLIQITA